MKRAKPCQHTRKVRTVGGTKFIIINKGICKPTRKRIPTQGPVTVGDRNMAVAIIKNLMKDNRQLARERGKITAKQAKLYPLSLSKRDEFDKQENYLQHKGRNNRDKIAFLEKQYDLDIKNY